MKKNEIGSYIALLIALLICVIQYTSIYNLRKEVALLQEREKILCEKFEQTESSCKRMTDTCIDIITNRRWEHGN